MGDAFSDSWTCSGCGKKMSCCSMHDEYECIEKNRTANALDEFSDEELKEELKRRKSKSKSK